LFHNRAQGCGIRSYSRASSRIAFQVAQLVHFDPRRRYVICAAGLIDSSEKLLGIGAITFDGDRSPQPDLLLTYERYGDELRRLLSRALRGMAESIRRGRAA
jgi:hypothetical protein